MVIFEFRDLRIFSVMLVHMSVIHICWQHQPFWIVSLFLTAERVSRVLMCSSIFYYPKKWHKETLFSFVYKNEIKCARIFEMLTVTFGEPTMKRTQVQLWYNRFKKDRKGAHSSQTSTSITD